jgi:DNA topoisomerase-1
VKESLVIVESPAKARTLGRYLGKGYAVMASVGHVRDLPKNELGIDVEAGFEPTYEPLPAKRKVIGELQSAAAKADRILLATDPDREGEAIGWHVAELLRSAGKPVQRVLFHEITKQAVQEALAHPRELDVNLINSQQARRVLDRLVGYTLSPLLWDKVKRGLSAGRVQSVALKMICDREAEIAAFVPEEYWHLDARLAADAPPPFVARLALKDGKKLIVHDGATTAAIKEEVEKAPFVVAKVNRRRRQQKAPPPFVTAKLQQAAYARYRFPVRKTMQLAQRLYEGVDLGGGERVGLITYMRTDSVRVAAEALDAVRQLISGQYGADFLPERPNFFKNRSEAQDAHEAVRPSEVARTPESLSGYLAPDELKLYTLIWQRFVASQMVPAQFDVTDVVVEAGVTVSRCVARSRSTPVSCVCTARRRSRTGRLRRRRRNRRKRRSPRAGCRRSRSARRSPSRSLSAPRSSRSRRRASPSRRWSRRSRRTASAGPRPTPRSSRRSPTARTSPASRGLSTRPRSAS